MILLNDMDKSGPRSEIMRSVRKRVPKKFRANKKDPSPFRAGAFPFCSVPFVSGRFEEGGHRRVIAGTDLQALFRFVAEEYGAGHALLPESEGAGQGEQGDRRVELLQEARKGRDLIRHSAIPPLLVEHGVLVGLDVALDEIELTFAGDFRGTAETGRPVRVEVGALDDSEQSEFHGFLGGFGAELLDVPICAERVEESVPAGIDAVLPEELCQF